jgi:predicted GNAT family acetyltransferase
VPDARSVADPQEFLDAAGPLLLADEARHNVILGLARTLVEQPGHYPERRLWVVEDAGAVVGAAVRTPPYNLAIARPAVGGALDALAEAIDDDLPGVSGAVPEVDRFAAAWSERTGRVPRVEVRMALYRLERVVPATAPGAARAATHADLDLLCRWWRAFLDEVSHDPPASDADVETAVRLRLDADGWGIGLWEDGGEPVSLTAFGNPTPNGARIGPVYTPPEARGRGYAGALVAHVSRALLDSGRRFCFLYADAANPSANGIYRRIGYEQVCESANVAFV